MLKRFELSFLPMWLTVAALLGHLGWLVFHWGSPADAEWYSDLHYLAVIYASTLLCLVSLRKVPAHLRAGMRLLCAAMVIRSVGDSIWTSLELLTKAPPFPSLADFFYLLEYPFFGWAFLHFSHVPLRPLKALRLALDSLILVAALATGLWWVLLFPILQAPGASTLGTLVSFAYPVFDLGLLGLLLLLALHGKRVPPYLTLFALGFGFTIVADLGFVYLVNQDLYRTGNPIDAFFTGGFLLWGLGAWQARRQAGTLARLGSTSLPPLARPLRQGLAALPYLAVTGACVFLLGTLHLDDPRHPGVLVGTILTMLLVIARQAIAFADNARLTHDLRRFTRELEESRAQLAHQAWHDPLTELPNRAFFENRLARALGDAAREERELAVLFIDLDDFKAVNDTHGHAAGDTLLHQVAQRLQTALRGDDLVARQGGDEFLVLLDLSDGRQVETVGRQCLQALTTPFEVQGHSLTVGASIGVSLFPQDAREAGELCRRADLAMYHAKRAGKNHLSLFAADQAVGGPSLIEERLRGALDRGELTLHYQPQFDVRGERVVATEALLRWTDAELGPVSPEHFIPLAESTGLVVEIGAWVLDEACRQAAVWRQVGWKGHMAVNVSPRQLAEPEWVERVLGTLERHGLRGPDLELELTEHAVVQDARAAAQTLGRLRDAGVRIAVDDFGTGHTTLLYLLEFPLQVLKIDRRLVQGALEREGERRVLQALVALAQGLTLDVVAEGVETGAQRAQMEELGVGFVQGYLLGRPVAADQLTGLLVPSLPAGSGAPGQVSTLMASGSG
ncbi:putative bifunctional diguanylate cyclase/phosphodiesterase [Deinococcus aestuarii]|uniref:putative bifunctional diguanylate cyclase/phosphodiesterase n=1 Tax=Deinococcus aestuarii TaxID=2774531 RepID=UPI001C0C0674|nr:EAL domain-containing protein [Deinococcus aestuarii]